MTTELYLTADVMTTWTQKHLPIGLDEEWPYLTSFSGKNNLKSKLNSIFLQARLSRNKYRIKTSLFLSSQNINFVWAQNFKNVKCPPKHTFMIIFCLGGEKKLPKALSFFLRLWWNMRLLVFSTQWPVQHEMGSTQRSWHIYWSEWKHWLKESGGERHYHKSFVSTTVWQQLAALKTLQRAASYQTC